LAIRASERASGFARWAAMKSRLLRNAPSRPAQFSPALLMPVLTANAPPASVAAATPISSFRVRPLILFLRYMQRSSAFVGLPRCSINSYGTATGKSSDKFLKYC
jgi:hypothetical protein